MAFRFNVVTSSVFIKVILKYHSVVGKPKLQPARFTLLTQNCLVVGVRLAVPSSFLSRDRTKRVRQAVPLQPGQESHWPIVKSQALRNTRARRKALILPLTVCLMRLNPVDMVFH